MEAKLYAVVPVEHLKRLFNPVAVPVCAPAGLAAFPVVFTTSDEFIP
jgi:hypothetical protein